MLNSREKEYEKLQYYSLKQIVLLVRSQHRTSEAMLPQLLKHFLKYFLGFSTFYIQNKILRPP